MKTYLVNFVGTNGYAYIYEGEEVWDIDFYNAKNEKWGMLPAVKTFYPYLQAVVGFARLVGDAPIATVFDVTNPLQPVLSPLKF